MRKVDSIVDRTICGKVMESPIMNGAGSCKTIEDFNLVMNSSASAAVIGSGTIPLKQGNEGTTYKLVATGALNSIGLRNGGKPYYEDKLAGMAVMGTLRRKPVHFSLACNSPGEYAELALVGRQAGVDCLEINLGCPNKYGPDGQQDRIFSYMPIEIVKILYAVRSAVGPHMAISIKVSPYTDIYLMREVGDVISDDNLKVSAVVGPNTFPNCVAFDSKGNLLVVPQHGGYAGGSGSMLKHVGLGQVKRWREILPKHIQIIGVGGISTGRDVLEYLWAGADAVQVVTAILGESGHVTEASLQVLERITKELEQLVSLME